MSDHEQIGLATQALEDSIYATLDAIDTYRELVERLRQDQRASDEPNTQLIHRYGQFLGKADAMTTAMEDGVLTEFLFCRHRLFAVDLSERGEFI